MLTETGTLFVDWVDYLVLPAAAEPSLQKTGFTVDPLGETPDKNQITLWHPDAMLPRIILDRALPGRGHPQALAIRVEILSDFPFLTQAFTEGERWPVRRERAERPFRAGQIDEKQLDQFMREGAIGSHLENLQRKGGFKGFNQTPVSVIIQATDPRKQGHGA